MSERFIAQLGSVRRIREDNDPGQKLDIPRLPRHSSQGNPHDFVVDPRDLPGVRGEVRPVGNRRWPNADLGHGCQRGAPAVDGQRRLFAASRILDRPALHRRRGWLPHRSGPGGRRGRRDDRRASGSAPAPSAPTTRSTVDGVFTIGIGFNLAVIGQAVSSVTVIGSSSGAK